MEVQRYQWVGLLAGVPLFSGAWLSAFYNTPWWGVLGLLLSVGGVYVGNMIMRRDDIETYAKRGFIAGALATIVARLLGWVASVMAGNQVIAGFGSLADMFRVVLAGDWWGSFLLVVLMGVIGAAVASLEPTAKGRK